MNLSRVHISTKLWAFITAVVVSICSVAAIGLVRSAAIIGEGRAAQSAAVDLVLIATKWTGMTETNAARNHAILISASPTTLEAFDNPVKATSSQISELQKNLDAMAQTAADKAQLKKIADLRATVIEWREKARKLKADGNDAEALKVMNASYLPAMTSYIGAQHELVRIQTERVAQIQADTEARRSANTTFILVGLCVILVAILAGTGWLVRSIREPLDQANLLASYIAQGDLSSTVVTHREDEFGALLNSLGTMNQSLGRMVSEVRSSTDSIATASAEIAHGNNDLAQRTEQTSSNLQGTASSMDTLTGTVQHSANNARQASSLAANASSVAQRGGSVVNQVVSTMQEINDSSKKIADIIGVIDGIAFQTNILALNAAVEAARAGEQGRGFAVVASEVRSLAGRSSEAAKEIRSLIGRSVEKVESGTKLVTDAGATMNEIVDSVQKVADVIGEITAAATEQSAGIAEVNKTICDLDQMTQQNAALVEESAAAAESLRAHADRLKQAVSVFKVSGQNDGATLTVAKVRPVSAPYR
ncbi:MAG: MCP four helix bundle domain-containing protein [Burkholderiaceae bacterium]|jgi:methyl-accepting chemotaxis protein|nr:MCP four helix bundle domain-containing protein [Burkholderiaceae bacterium]